MICTTGVTTVGVCWLPPIRNIQYETRRLYVLIHAIDTAVAALWRSPTHDACMLL